MKTLKMLAAPNNTYYLSIEEQKELVGIPTSPFSDNV
jgi:hypothetical protein